MYQQGMPQGQGAQGMQQGQGAQAQGMQQGQGPQAQGMQQGPGPSSHGMMQGAQGSQGMQQGHGPSSHGMMQGAQVAPAYSQPQMMMMAPGAQNYGHDPQTMTCPFCQVTMTTRVQYDSGSTTQIACILLYFFFCCCCIAYCGDWAKDAKHHCSSCGRYVGTGKPFG